MYNAEGIIIVWYASTRATSIPSRAHYSGREIPADVSGKVHEEQSWKLPSPRGRYHGFKLSRRGEREVRRETAGYISSRRHASTKCRSSPCFERATPPFTGVSNQYLTVHHLRYRTLIILDTDSIRLSFSLFLHFVKFSNEQFYRIWFYYWLFLILSGWFNIGEFVGVWFKCMLRC